jgi:hypothetical protein
MQKSALALLAGLAGFTSAADARAASDKVLWSFDGGKDGWGMGGGVIADASGNLYGVTVNGGDGTVGTDSGNGVAYMLAPPPAGKFKWKETVLYRFKPVDDGSGPTGTLLMGADGVLYGATAYGGNGVVAGQSNSGYGTIFQLTPPAAGQKAWTETQLYAFQGGSDGQQPTGSLIADAAGGLYGTTSVGGAGYGTVFKLTPPAAGRTTWTESVLYRFAGSPDGASPNPGLLRDAAHNLYGTTWAGGGAQAGTAFMLSPPAKGGTAWTETVLSQFSNSPQASLTFGPQGVLYGTTTFEESACPPSCGTVFQLTPPTGGTTNWTLQTIWAFAGPPSDGSWPGGDSLLTHGADGKLYGTTVIGGSGDCALGAFGCGLDRKSAVERLVQRESLRGGGSGWPGPRQPRRAADFRDHGRDELQPV